MNIYFDKSFKKQFLDTQKLGTDTNGYVIDTQTNHRVSDELGQPIKARNFAGIRKGSRIFLSNDIDTVIREAALDQKKHG